MERALPCGLLGMERRMLPLPPPSLSDSGARSAEERGRGASRKLTVFAWSSRSLATGESLRLLSCSGVSEELRQVGR